MARQRNDSRTESGELSERYLVSRIAKLVEDGMGGEDGDVSSVRQTMFERYYGELYGNERDGFSKFVTREVLEAVEWALPAIMRVFMGGVKAVEFSASGPDDVEQAAHETDVVNYWFYDGNDEYSGFLTLYSWMKDTLLYPNAYVKVTFDDSEVDIETETYKGLTQAQLDVVEEGLKGQDAELQVMRKYRGRGADGVAQRLFDISVATEKVTAKIEVEPVAPDEVIIVHGHNKLDLDGAKFVCLRTKYSRTELIDMGYDEDELDEARADFDAEWASERTTRMFYSDESPDEDAGEFELESDEEFWRHECYMRVDYDGDGRAERRRIVMVGSKIFENEKTDYCPIVSTSAMPMPHKHIGMGYAELVADLQELHTTLTRQLLDNIYKQNVRRVFVNEQSMLSDNTTMDQLLDGESEVVEFRGPPSEAVMPEMVQPIVGDIASVIQMFSDRPQLRTGVAPQLTLDPSVLKESTMGAFVGAMEQASQRLELLARMFAETGLKRVFQKIHYLLRTYYTGTQQVQINKKWVPINPSTWKKRSNMSVNVGLGFNNKQAMITLLTTLLQIQREAMGAGLSNPEKIYNTLEQLVEQANMGHAGTYFVDPKSEEFKPPQPQKDAQMIAAEAQAKSLEADAKRRDAELKFNMEKWKEESEQRAAELMARLDELQQNYTKLVADNALKDAQIQKLNAEAVAAAQMPQTADDEFARGEARVRGGQQQQQKSKPAKNNDNSGKQEAKAA